MKKRATPADPAVQDDIDIFNNEDEDEEEVEDEKSRWIASRHTKMGRGELKVTAQRLMKAICLKAQQGIDNAQELTFLAGRLAQIDADLIILGNDKGVFPQEKAP